MKIERRGLNGTTPVSRARPRTGGGEQSFQVSEPAPASAGSTMTGLSGVNAASAVVLAQSDSGPDPERKKNLNRANDLLDQLEELRLGMLSGRLESRVLENLASRMAEQRAEVNDPGLAEAIDAVELRVAVELAKYQR